MYLYGKQYHVFISHAWDYHSDYDKIKQWLDEADRFSWSDYSVPLEKRLDVASIRELKSKLENRISRCGCFVIPAGMYDVYSDWIAFEIDTAVRYGKPIIGIEPWGHQRIPRIVADNATCMVGWNASSVVRAIREHSL